MGDMDPILQMIGHLRDDVKRLEEKFDERMDFLMKEHWVQTGRRLAITSIISLVVTLLTLAANAYFRG